jgi:hypothetical protein
MLASRIGGFSLLVTMVDDSMEIENGDDIGDEDIDIDIDLTTGQPDEDHVLGDAGSNVDFEDDAHLQMTATGIDDELMVDDETGSFSMPMDDDNISDEGDQTMEHEPHGMPFTAANRDANSPVTDFDARSTAGTGFVVEGLATEAEVTWESHDDSVAPVNEPVIHQPSFGQSGHATGRISPNNSNSEVTAVPAVDAAEGGDGQVGISLISNPEDNATKEQISSPHHESPEPTLEVAATSDAIPEQPLQSPEALVDSTKPEATDDAQESVAVESDIDLRAPREVLVYYQQTEYTLFPTSELDEPDSYFLSDLAICDKPLSSFFASLRDVIHDDLSDEDEICLSVEDLGLDIEEVSYNKSSPSG